MRLILEGKSNISVTKLPVTIDGNYWIQYDNNNLINIEAKDNTWVINSNNEIKITKDKTIDELSNINYLENIILEENQYYYLINIMTKDMYTLYSVPSYEKFENFIIDYNKNNNIVVGKDTSCDIIINNELFQEKEFSIEYDKNSGNVFIISNNNSDIYINNKRIVEKNNLISGDIIFIKGIFIYYFGALVLISNNKNDLKFNSLRLSKRVINDNSVVDYSKLIDQDVKVFEKEDYFQRPPRFKRYIEHKDFEIDPPTQKESEEDTPLIFTLAPMVTMGMSSILTLVSSMQKVVEGNSSLKNELGALLISGGMMITMILFPLIQNYYTKYKRKQKEKKRRRKYKKYIDSKREEIRKEIDFERQVLIESNLDPINIRNIVLTKSRNLWERKIEHADFLDLRLGMGSKKPDIEIKYPELHFTLEEDDLKDIMYELVEETKDIENVPISLNIKDNNKVGIIGEKDILSVFIDNLMLQIIAYHGYDVLKIIILTNNDNKTYWDKYRNLPYLWNNSKSVRYYATSKDEINKLTSTLMEEYNYRKENINNKEVNNDMVYYLVLTDDITNVKNNIFINSILKDDNLGYSLVMCVDKLDLLPSECSTFINVTKEISGLFENQMKQDNQISFKADLLNFSLRKTITTICNTPIDINSGKFVLPSLYGFLEMYDVGNVNQLNIKNRWENSDIINSLSCPVGIDESGELFNIDLHEKAHGPHGLVAGMTGSGKSEWIITYILSMAINYSPEEVQFVLIDYKGGGLALTFDNRENNIKLPHVVGTITNLDVVEINRSLASIEAELKRRQAMFKSAREELNESSMDIYKYQDLYREGKIKEPMSHLFIISDEFAELKAQQPDFMDELISTARIGRSLGVHLILATQKPSGVVNDQIWSNSKFRVCLKVQDKSDSNEMIMCPDAALIKETGRFYLQVGYNEFFAKGQSAYAGVPYLESDKKINIVDSSIDFIDEIGNIIKHGDIKKNNTEYVQKGEELPNILNYIIETSKKENLNIRQLWLSRIPAVIYVDKIIEKYNWVKEDYVLNPVIGEYDYPTKQTQNILTLPITEQGNTIIYGSVGSGKENLVTTILYSLINNYSLEEVYIYIVDFGTEVLNSFKIAPHIGDIVHMGDNDKIENLFKLLTREINDRKKRYSEYNGNYIDYIKKSGKKDPNIIVFFNQFDIFDEEYVNYNDIFVEISRDANKYGIFFVLTTSSERGIRSKITQYYNNVLVLQFNDSSVYKSLLNSRSNIIPSKLFGRGLAKKEDVVEFQTAYAFEKDTLYDSINALSKELFKQYKKRAVTIPILPEHVLLYDLIQKPIDISCIPIGVSKESLSIKGINLKEQILYMICTKSMENINTFLKLLINIINIKNKSFNSYIIDMNYLLEKEEIKDNYNYYTNNFDKLLTEFDNYVNRLYEIYINNNLNKKSVEKGIEIVCLIIGFNKFINSLSVDNQKIFENIITKSKDVNKIHFLCVDIPTNFKKCEYNMSWYKESIDNTNGLWIGSGTGEQSVIRITKTTKEHNVPIDNNFGFVIENGETEFVKVMDRQINDNE